MVWLPAVVAAALAAKASEPRALSDLARESTVVAVGTVTRAEISGESAVGELSVEVQLRGAASATLRYADAPRGEFHPGPPLGARVLVFLRGAPAAEPSRTGEPSRAALAGDAIATLRIERPAGRDLVVAAPDDFAVDDTLCGEPSGARPSCRIPLETFVTRVLGVTLPPSPAPHARFWRAAPRQCSRCDLDATFAAARTKRGVHLCPSDPPRGPDAQAQCIRAQVDAKAPFVARVRLAGVDSTIERLWSSDEGVLRLWDYDSSVEGGGSCAATVRVRTCTGIAPDPRTGSLECVGARAEEVVCDQTRHRVQFLSPASDAQKLSCATASGDAGFDDCAVQSPSKSRPYQPRADGPDLVCSGPDGDMDCYEW